MTLLEQFENKTLVLQVDLENLLDRNILAYKTKNTFIGWTFLTVDDNKELTAIPFSEITYQELMNLSDFLVEYPDYINFNIDNLNPYEQFKNGLLSVSGDDKKIRLFISEMIPGVRFPKYMENIEYGNTVVMYSTVYKTDELPVVPLDTIKKSQPITEN